MDKEDKSKEPDTVEPGSEWNWNHLWFDRRFHLAILILCSLLIFLGRPTSASLRNYDDAYYAQKGKEILQSQDWWILRWNGTPDFANPPFPFWTLALAFKGFGVSGYSAILPSALFALLTVVLTYRFAEILFRDRWLAFCSAFILLFPGYFVENGRRCMLDATETFLVTAALYGFWRGLQRPNYFWLFAIASGCAILTKSILGLFPLIIVAGFLLVNRLESPIPWKAIALSFGGSLVLGGSWFVINWTGYGDAFVKEHFARQIMEKAVSDTKPWYHIFGYLQDLLKNYWPWVPVTFIGLSLMARQNWVKRDSATLLLLIWVAVIIGGLSLATTKMLRYILPAFPALALVTAKTLADWLPQKRQLQAVPYMIAFLFVVVLLINATPWEIKQSKTLSPNSVDVRTLAPLIKQNTPANQEVMNFRLSQWNPRSVLMFYGDRMLSNPVREYANLIRHMQDRPDAVWLTSIEEYRTLEKQFPDLTLLILAQGKYASFTSRANRLNIRYDLSR